MEFPLWELASSGQYKAFLKQALCCPASQKCATVCGRTADVLITSGFSLCNGSVTALPVLGPPVPFCWDSSDFWRFVVIFQQLLLLNNIF